MILVLAKFSFVMIFGYYVITALQWFSYKINRVIFHYTKPMWHIYFIILPLILISVFDSIIYQISITILYLIATIFWAYKLDKRVVITARVKRFFAFLVVGFGLFSFCPYSGIWLFHTLLAWFLPLYLVLLVKKL